jgi:hypothetical protein
MGQSTCHHASISRALLSTLLPGPKPIVFLALTRLQFCSLDTLVELPPNTGGAMLGHLYGSGRWGGWVSGSAEGALLLTPLKLPPIAHHSSEVDYTP